MAGPLGADSAHDIGGQSIVDLGGSSLAPEDGPEVELLEREEAGPELALGRDADSVAVAAERLCDAGDHSDVAATVGVLEALGRFRVAAPGQRQLGEGERR